MFKKILGPLALFTVIFVWAGALLAQQFQGAPAPFRMSTATNTTTLTLSQMFGLLVGTPTAAANYSTPTAAQLCTVWPGVAILAPGTNSASVGADWIVKNTSGGANTITISPGTGVTINGTGTIAQNAARVFKLVPGNCVPGSELYDIESVANSTF